MSGIITRKRPGIDRYVESVGPFVPTPSLITCTTTSCPRFSARWIGGRSRRGVFFPTRSVASSSSPGKYRGCRSVMCRKPLCS